MSRGRRVGPWRIRQPAPAQGERRFPKRKTLQQQTPVQLYGVVKHRSVKVVRMFNALLERGWTFRFEVEAKSPGGWPYRGEGATAAEAFLKAFGQWRAGSNGKDDHETRRI